jgi:hypothetical protein
MAWQVGDLQLALVGVGRPAGDVEAKSKPCAGAGGRRVQAGVPLEDPVAIGRWNPGALILDGEDGVAVPTR